MQNLKSTAENPTQKPKLMDQVRYALRTKHYSYKTKQAYLPWIYRFVIFHNKKIVYMRIKYGERTLGITVKAAGGKWNKKKKLWELPYKETVELGLTNRIVWEENQNVS